MCIVKMPEKWRIYGTFREMVRVASAVFISLPRFSKLVLFSGTGCQVNGLKSFLGKEYENLICVDVICHGAPSPALWRKYAEHQEQR